MFTRLWIALPLLPVMALVGPASDSSPRSIEPALEPTLEVFELAVRREPKTKGATLYAQAGVELKVAIRVPDTPLLSVAADSCKLTKWTDDKGTDLAQGAPTGFLNWVEMESRFGDDIQLDTAVLTLKTETLPAPEAGRMTLESTVAMLSASDLQEETVELVLEKGHEFTLAGIAFELSGVDREEWGDVVLQVEFQSEQPLDAIQALEFQGPDGTLIEHDDMGSSSWGFGGKTTYSRTYGLKKAAEAAKVKATYYAKLEEIAVPLNLELGLGLQITR